MTLGFILITTRVDIFQRRIDGYLECAVLDLGSDLGGLSRSVYNRRMFEFFAWLCGFLVVWWNIACLRGVYYGLHAR